MAEEGRSRHASLANRAARLHAPVVHALALLAFAGRAWRTRGDLRLAVNVGAAVLTTTCPVNFALAVPAATAAASGRLLRRGVLVKDGTGLERPARVDKVVLDKTGTLTLGAPEPQGPGAHQPEDLAVALALAQGHDFHLFSSDVAPAVEARAARLGILAWTARATPEDKAAHLARLAREGRRVLMVGDGLNDTAALSEALVSIPPASGLDAAPVADALMTARRWLRRVR